MLDDSGRWLRRASGLRLVVAGLVTLGSGLMVASILGLGPVVAEPRSAVALVASGLVRPWAVGVVETLLVAAIALMVAGKGACLLAGPSGRIARLVELSVTLDASALVIHALGWWSSLGPVARVGPPCVVGALMMLVQAVGFLARAESADRRARRIARSGSALGVLIALGLFGFAIAPVAAVGGWLALVLGAAYLQMAGRWAASKADPEAKPGPRSGR